jgi:hypothetical protein
MVVLPRLSGGLCADAQQSVDRDHGEAGANSTLWSQIEAMGKLADSALALYQEYLPEEASRHHRACRKARRFQLNSHTDRERCCFPESLATMRQLTKESLEGQVQFVIQQGAPTE